MNATLLAFVTMWLVLIVSGALTAKADMKPKTLSVLMLLPLTGDEPRNGAACQIASDIVLNEVNSRSDILPGYHLEAVYRDEGAGSLQAPRQVAAFKQNFQPYDNNKPNRTAYPSPLMMGPFFSTGCKAVAGHVHHYDMATLSTGCSAPQPPANRRLYPNLYRSRITGELVAYPKLHFIREIGGWRRFGIVTNAGNVFDYTLATFLLKEAENNGFEVSFFDCIPDVDENTIQQLKASDTRVVVVDFTVPPLILKFLCMAYRFGMTGARYVFLLFYGSYFEPPAMAANVAGCSREQIFQQLRSTFWVAWSSFTADDKLRSTLGHNLSEFERLFDSALSTANLPKPADYDKRVLCYDAAISATTALHSAENRLLARNMTLSDYQTYPQEVIKIVNSSMASVNFNGLRIGRFQYSEKRAELEYDSFVAIQWTPESGRVVLSWFELGDVGSVYNYSSYSTKSLAQPKWPTLDGKPPRDERIVRRDLYSVPRSFFYAITALSAAIASIQVGVFFKRAYDRLRLTKELLPESGICYLTLGCLFFNASAVVFAIPADSTAGFSDATCIFQRVLISLAFAFVQIGLLSPLLFHQINYGRRRKFSQNGRFQMATFQAAADSSGLNRPGTVTAINQAAAKRKSRRLSRNSRHIRAVSFHFARPAPVDELNLDHLAHIAGFFLAGFGIVTVPYLIVWLVVGGTPRSVRSSLRPAVYNEDDDTLRFSDVYICTSPNDTMFCVVLAAIHAVFLIAGVIMAFTLRHCKPVSNGDDTSPTVRSLTHAHELPAYRLCSYNIATLFFGGILLVIVLSSPVDQMVAISIVLISLSTITGLILSFKGDINKVNKISIAQGSPFAHP